jgi:hypothetical protein
MIFSFGQKDRGQLDYLAFALNELGQDLYKEILGSYWEFVYQRNFWMGISLDQEGKLMKIRLDGIEKSKIEILNQQAGLKLEYIEANAVKAEAVEADGILIQTQSNLKTEQFSSIDEDFHFYFYLPKTKVLTLVSKAGKKLESNSVSLDEFKQIINQPYYPQLKIFSIKRVSVNRELLDIDKWWLRWYQKMNQGTRKIKYGIVEGTGFAGMELLLEDICLFSKHGHPEWMQAWKESVISRLQEIARIRQGNQRFLEIKLNITGDSEQLPNIDTCINQWRKIEATPANQWSYENLIHWLKTVIELERSYLSNLEIK